MSLRTRSGECFFKCSVASGRWPRACIGIPGIQGEWKQLRGWLLRRQQSVCVRLALGFPSMAIIWHGTRRQAGDCPFVKLRARFDTCLRLRLSGPRKLVVRVTTCPQHVSQFVEKLLSPVSSQGQLSVAFFQVSAFVILLVLYLILYKDVKARFLRFWMVGWALLTCGAITRLVEQFQQNRHESGMCRSRIFWPSVSCWRRCWKYSPVP